jgi:hypothetical protein
MRYTILVCSLGAGGGYVGDFSAKIPLIGVGPARTASTWLYQVIADTRLAERASTKEISFFDKH